jgi:NADPH-dependent curcumin reductase CurA
MSGQQARKWILANPPKSQPVLEGDNATFRLETSTLPAPDKDQVLLKTLYLSNDPAQRGWIQQDVDPERLYVPPVQKNDIMRAFGVCEVITSKADNLKEGQLVIGTVGWTEYSVMNAKELRPIQPDEAAGIRATNFLGSIGATGLTAYYGLVDVVRTTKEDVVVVSGAAGATGNMVVQIAKHLVGCKKVIGIAGGESKCKWVESLGADICIDYKAADFKEQLWKATEGYVDVYFDNVGGDILNMMLQRMKRHGRISACGSISTYNTPGEQGITNWFEIIANRIEIKGFIVLDAYMAGKADSMIGEIIKGVKEGKIHIGKESETIVPTSFEDIPKTWMTLFKGGNQGKLITQITG